MVTRKRKLYRVFIGRKPGKVTKIKEYLADGWTAACGQAEVIRKEHNLKMRILMVAEIGEEK